MQSDFNHRREQELLLIKHRLSFLPEIKEEIQRYLEVLSIRYDFSKLQKSLSRLNELPNIQETLESSDDKKLVSIFGKFETAKSIAQLEILTLQTNLEIGVNGWNVGKHAIRDHSGLEVGELIIDHLWAANILPSFEVPARIIVLHQPAYYRIVFGLALSPDKVSPLVIQMEISKSWTDPLENMLRQIDLFHGERRLFMDGIGYELYNLSWASESFISFANPFTSPFVELEKAFFSVAEMVVNEKGQQTQKDYLTSWQRYLVKY